MRPSLAVIAGVEVAPEPAKIAVVGEIGRNGVSAQELEFAPQVLWKTNRAGTVEIEQEPAAQYALGTSGRNVLDRESVRRRPSNSRDAVTAVLNPAHATIHVPGMSGTAVLVKEFVVQAM